MINHTVRVSPSREQLDRSDQLAHKLAELAADPVEVTADVTDMVVNRVIDNAAVAVASLRRPPVVNARAQALAHPATPGSTVFGVPPTTRVSPEWAAWANGVAVRELDYHDTFLAADYSHPGDNIPPVLAVGQALGRSGRDLVRGIATGYEVQIDLTTAICLHEHKIDHVAHLGPSAAAGIGTLLGLPAPVIAQAIGQALHLSTATRQSRKGRISSWKAYAPAAAGKVAVEAVDRAMRGEGSPEPIYEGEDGVIAWLLDGPGAEYHVALPAPGEAKLAVLKSFTKEHSAEYQAQALIDLAVRLRSRVPDTSRIRDVLIRTSHHTHTVIGTGSGDPQKFDPAASRETLDHSIMYIFAVALQDGRWHHEDSYAPSRAQRPDTVALWRRIRTEEDADWTRRYHSADLAEKAFGGDVVITFEDGTEVRDQIAVADAHPLGARPFGRDQYVRKFRTLAEGIVEPDEQDRFLAAAVAIPELPAGGLDALTVSVDLSDLPAPAEGIFR